LKNLVGAFRTLTMLPVPGPDGGSGASGLPWFPLVGAVLGLAGWGLAAGLLRPGTLACGPLGCLLVGALVVVLWAWLTRGLHLDGLADLADGLGGGWTRERVLEIMKDSHVGSFGVLALVGGLMVKTAAAGVLCASGDLFWLGVAPVMARWAMVAQACFHPYARPGQGTAADLVRQAGPAHLLGASALALLLLAGMTLQGSWEL
jgi:adenosylcobinamide-GDP ribazoletransferase